MIYILQPGTMVLIGPVAEPVTGTIVDVLISTDTYVQYKVEWWDGLNRRVEYFDSWQVRKLNDTGCLQVGFK